MQTKKITVLGLCTALALIFSYIENMLPLPLPVPGAKVGLANTLIVVLLYRYGIKESLCVNVLRILLSGFLFGNIFGIFYSLSGAVCSFGVMLLVKKCPLFQIKTVSILGGVMHNIGQLLFAMVIVSGMSLFVMLPYLIVTGMIAGLCNGILAEIIYKRGIL